MYVLICYRINQKINQALAGYQPPKEEVFYDSSEEVEKTEEKEEPQLSTSTSRYDSLLDNLNKEDAEREKKKQEREAAKNKFAEAERQRDGRARRSGALEREHQAA